VTPIRVNGLPPFVSVVVAAGKGGPSDIHQFFQSIDKSCPSEFFVVQHGPDWMMKLLARQIKLGAGFPCAVDYLDLQPTPGNIYLARADHYLTFSPPPVSLELNQESKENYLRSSADCFFRNATTLFGEFCVAIILTGLVRDGSQGAKNIKASAGEQFLLKTPRLRQYLICHKPRWARR
jgi:two-component system, chemotaxis family, protein-glutamate methylesterase/glutaminase